MTIAFDVHRRADAKKGGERINPNMKASTSKEANSPHAASSQGTYRDRSNK
jgi:hypothetical protein